MTCAKPMLNLGSRIAAFEVVSLIGQGGMGEVYRATDTKLGRDVALKILPASFTTDPERVARFRREAQVLASLNHPHIGQIYGLEESNGTQFLVLELIDGESLDGRIARGPIPVEESFDIAKQIAEALEAAHEKGLSTEISSQRTLTSLRAERLRTGRAACRPLSVMIISQARGASAPRTNAGPEPPPWPARLTRGAQP
jgi:serine/threonine protein kinase